MRGVLLVSEAGVAEDDDLVTWLERGLDFAGSLSPK